MPKTLPQKIDTLAIVSIFCQYLMSFQIYHDCDNVMDQMTFLHNVVCQASSVGNLIIASEYLTPAPPGGWFLT